MILILPKEGVHNNPWRDQPTTNENIGNHTSQAKAPSYSLVALTHIMITVKPPKVLSIAHLQSIGIFSATKLKFPYMLYSAEPRTISEALPEAHNARIRLLPAPSELI